MVEQALDTSESVDPKSQIEDAEVALYRVAEEGGEEGGVKTFGQATRIAVATAERIFSPREHAAGSMRTGGCFQNIQPAKAEAGAAIARAARQDPVSPAAMQKRKSPDPSPSAAATNCCTPRGSAPRMSMEPLVMGPPAAHPTASRALGSSALCASWNATVQLGAYVTAGSKADRAQRRAISGSGKLFLRIDSPAPESLCDNRLHDRARPA